MNGGRTPADICADYAASQIHRTDNSTARIIIGEGRSVFGSHRASAASDMLGTLYIKCGSVTLKKTVQCYTNREMGFACGAFGGVGAPATSWLFRDDLLDYVPTDVIYPDGNLLLLSDGGNDAPLENAFAGQYVAYVLVEKNDLTSLFAPQMIPAWVVTYDVDWNEIARSRIWLVKCNREDFGPNRIAYYSHWEKPIVFVNGEVDPGLHPSLTIIKATESAFVDIQTE